VQEATIKDYKN